MGEAKRKQEQQPQKEFIFRTKNYHIMFVGIFFIALGFILMAGGGSDDPNVFNPEIFNWRRIRLAPTLIIIGFAIQVYAILYSSNKNKSA